MTAENMLDVQETTDTELYISHTLEESFDLENDSTGQDISKVLYNFKLKSLELTLSLYDANAMPRNQVVKIQNSFASMLKSISHSLERLLDKRHLSTEVIRLIDFCKDSFEGNNSEYKMLNTLTKLNLYREPKSFVIDEQISNIIEKGNPTLGIKSYHMYIMPLAFVFSKIFEIPTILEHSLKQIEASSLEPRLSNIINGKAFQNKLKKFNSLLVIPFIFLIL